MDNGVKGQSESGKVAGSAAPQPIKPNGFATAYLLVVDFLMLLFVSAVVLEAANTIARHGGELNGLNYVILVVGCGPVMLLLWLIGLKFCRYNLMGRDFYKYGGLVVILITALSFASLFLFG